MKKLFISCPMNGRTKEAIKDSMNRLHSLAEIIIGEKLEAIDSYIENASEFKDGAPESKIRLWYLGESIKKIGEADCADEWLQLIWSVGCDHDGFNDVDSLKRLIDELIIMSQNARTCMREGKLFSNPSESPDEK